MLCRSVRVDAFSNPRAFILFCSMMSRPRMAIRTTAAFQESLESFLIILFYSECYN